MIPEELPAVRVAKLKEIWDLINNLSIPLNISHYNALLRAYLENEYEFSPSEILAYIETKGLAPDR